MGAKKCIKRNHPRMAISIYHKDMLNIFGKYLKSSVTLYVLLGLVHILAVHLDYELIAIVVKRLNILVGLLFAYNISSYLIRNGYCKFLNRFFMVSGNVRTRHDCLSL